MNIFPILWLLLWFRDFFYLPKKSLPQGHKNFPLHAFLKVLVLKEAMLGEKHNGSLNSMPYHINYIKILEETGF